jgi:murein DD-endopeptidase MepM/ murein hydrolase activator NlpD
VFKIGILKKIAITTRKSIKLIVLMFLSAVILLALVVLFYNPTYEVRLNGEVIGFTADKSKLQERINDYTSGNEKENIAFVQIDAMPTYKLCLLKKDVNMNDDEIYNKVTEDGTPYYKYYAITDDKKEKYYVSSFKEAEEVIDKLEDKDSANQDELGIVEKYDKKIKEFTSVEKCVAKLYEEKPVVVYSGNAYSSGSSSGYVNLGINLINPISGIITSRYGSNDSVRDHTHAGLDIAAPTGTAIKAAASGTVTFSGWSGGYGYCIKLDHGNGVTTVYAHCSQLIASVGQSVSQGQIIAKVGSTGNSTGSHLHLEVRKNGVTYNPQNYVY